MAKISEKDGSIDLLVDYYNHKDQYAKLNFATLQGVKSTTEAGPKPPVCETKLIKNKGFNSNFTLPVLPPGAKEVINGGVKPKPSGKLVTISDWTVKHVVRKPDGTVLTGLAVKPLDGDGANGM